MVARVSLITVVYLVLITAPSVLIAMPPKLQPAKAPQQQLIVRLPSAGKSYAVSFQQEEETEEIESQEYIHELIGTDPVWRALFTTVAVFGWLYEILNKPDTVQYCPALTERCCAILNNIVARKEEFYQSTNQKKLMYECTANLVSGLSFDALYALKKHFDTVGNDCRFTHIFRTLITAREATITADDVVLLIEAHMFFDFFMQVTRTTVRQLVAYCLLGSAIIATYCSSLPKARLLFSLEIVAFLGLVCGSYLNARLHERGMQLADYQDLAMPRPIAAAPCHIQYSIRGSSNTSAQGDGIRLALPARRDNE